MLRLHQYPQCDLPEISMLFARRSCAQHPRRAALMLAAIVLPASLLAQADAGEQRVQIAIPQGRAADSVRALQTQVGMEARWGGLLSNNISTNEVYGYFTPAEAIGRLFAGTPLRFAIEDGKIFAWSCEEFPCESSDSSGSQPPPRLKQDKPDAPSPASGKQLVRPVPEVRVRRDRVLPEPSPDPSLDKVIVGRTQLDQSGALTVPDALSNLSQVFPGGVTEGNIILNTREANTNGDHATGVNIRGIGAASVAVTLDGHRTIHGGNAAMFTEADMFPIEGLAQIELQLDGPPLRYGADAIAGIINLVMNRQFIGSTTDLQSSGLTGNGRREYRFGHLQGWQWGDTHMVLAVEYRDQSALRAWQRDQYTNDLTRFGGSDFRQPYDQPGTLLVGSTLYAIPANRNGTSLTANTANLSDSLAGSDILPRQRRGNVFLYIEHRPADDLRLSAESLCSYRRVTDNAGSYTTAIQVDEQSPFYVNPTGGTGPVNVLYRFARELGPLMERAGVTTCDSTLELDAIDVHGWHFNGSLGYGYEKQNQRTDGLLDFAALTSVVNGGTFDPFGDGTQADSTAVDPFRSSSRFSASTGQWDVNLLAERTALSIPGGDVQTAMVIDYRKETLSTTTTSPSRSVPRFNTQLARSVAAAQAELSIPLQRRVTLAAVGRFDHYSDFGNVFSPEYVLQLRPTRSLSIRASWARLFGPPNIAQLIETNNSSQLFALPDARSPAGITQVLIDSGMNAGLHAEVARNWAVKLDFRSLEHTGPRARLTYFHIDAQGRIEDHALTADMLDNPAYRGIVYRNPTPEQRQAVCTHSQFAGSRFECLQAPVGAIVDLRALNTASLTTSGMDFDLAYGWQLRRSWLEAGLSGTYTFDFSEARSAGAPWTQELDTANFPINLRMRPMLQWQLGGLRALLAANYSNHYRDDSDPAGARNVASWTTFDTALSYAVGAKGTAFSGTQLVLTGRNLFGRDPPFVNNPRGVGFDLLNGDLGGRSIALLVRQLW